jgi:sialic acid synthase SpsE
MSKEVMIVAEMGASHHQDEKTAKELVEAAKWSGADAVKVQMFTADQMTLKSKDEKFVIKEGLWSGYRLYDLYEAAALPIEWVEGIKGFAEHLGLKFIASVYHPDMVDVAEKLKIPIYKIASFEITYPDLIEKVAQTKKPVMISTGMADYLEIKAAVNAVKKYHNKITLLHCVSEYPALTDKMNLKTIPALERGFRVRVGLSDHTDGLVSAAVSIALGARVIEKHIRVDDIGLDSFAVYPEQFRAMVEIIRATEKALGEVTYGGKKQFRRESIEGKMVRTAG